MILFIIWFNLRLLLLVPNCDTMFFLCSRVHFWIFVSVYFSITAVDFILYSLAYFQLTIFPLESTSAIMYLPGSYSGFWPERNSSPFFSYFLPYWTPFIWLNCKILIFSVPSFIVVALIYNYKGQDKKNHIFMRGVTIFIRIQSCILLIRELLQFEFHNWLPHFS